MTLSTFFRNTPRALVAALIVLATAFGAAAATLQVPAPSAVVAVMGGDDGDDDTPQVEARGALVPQRVHRGGAARADVVVTVSKGFHVQAHKPLDESYIATTLTWKKPRAGIRIGAPSFPQPVSRTLSFDERALPMYENAFVVRTRVSVARTVPAGTYMLTGTLRYQACSDEACYAPRTERVTIPVVVVR